MALPRSRLLLFILWALIPATCALVLAFSAWFIDRQVSQTEIANAKTQLDETMKQLSSRTPSMGALSIIDEVNRRLAIDSGKEVSTYYLIRRLDGRRVTGNLREWPRNIADRSNRSDPIRVANLPNSLVQTKEFGGDFEVLVARPLTYFSELRFWLILMSATCTFLVAFGTFLIVRYHERALRVDATRIEQTLGLASGGNYAGTALELENPVMQNVAENIDSLLDRLGHSTSILRQFGTSIAHELSTPLTKAQALLSDLEASDLKDEKLAQVKSHLEDLSQTFSSLLRLAAIENGRQFDEGFGVHNLASCVEDAIMLYRDIAQDSGISIKPSLVPVELLFDPWLVRTATANLLANAMRFSSQGDEIEVSVIAQKTKVLISIRDYGPGIAELDQSISLITTMSQISKSKSQHEQSRHGQGLKIVHAVALRHAGTLELRNMEKGLCARLILPRTI